MLSPLKLLLTSAFLSALASGSVGAAIVQMEGNFVAFNAEIGTLDDDPSNGSKFDVMAQDANSIGDYVVMTSPAANGEISYEVQFSENVTYTVYLRYRETGPGTPSFDIDLEGTSVAGLPLFVATTPDFEWVHLPSADITPAAGGATETFTITRTAGDNFEIDAIALVKQSAVTGGGFTVDDTSIPSSTFSIPEPSSGFLVLLGGLAALTRRRPRF